MIRLATFIGGTVVLVALSFTNADPLWTWWSSLLSAAAAWFTAVPVFEAWCVRRRPTAKSLALAYLGAGVPFDFAQLVVMGQVRPAWSVVNMLASGALLLCCGLVWSVDLRRFWLPATGAATVGTVALVAWSWP